MPRGEIRPLLTPELIRRSRRLAGLDQGQLAMLAGLSRKTIGAVETSLPTRVDPRRRLVLERIRSVFEREFRLFFKVDVNGALEGPHRRRLRRKLSGSASTDA